MLDTILSIMLLDTELPLLIQKTVVFLAIAFFSALVLKMLKVNKQSLRTFEALTHSLQTSKHDTIRIYFGYCDRSGMDILNEEERNRMEVVKSAVLKAIQVRRCFVIVCT